MPAATKPFRKSKITSLRLDDAVLEASAKKAAKLGVSRTFYIQQLLRKDLGLEGVKLGGENSVFG